MLYDIREFVLEHGPVSMEHVISIICSLSSWWGTWGEGAQWKSHHGCTNKLNELSDTDLDAQDLPCNVAGQWTELLLEYVQWTLWCWKTVMSPVKNKLLFFFETTHYCVLWENKQWLKSDARFGRMEVNNCIKRSCLQSIKDMSKLKTFKVFFV